EGQATSILLFATEPADPSASFTWSITSPPDGMTLTYSLTTMGTYTYGNEYLLGVPGYSLAAGPMTPGTVTATISVTDAYGSTSGVVTFSISDTDRLPSPFVPGATEGQTASVSMAATDNSGTNSLTYSGGSSLPHGLAIDPSTG